MPFHAFPNDSATAILVTKPLNMLFPLAEMPFPTPHSPFLFLSFKSQTRLS